MNDDAPTASEVRGTINNSRGLHKSLRHCSYRVWLNVFRKADRDEVDEGWRGGLSSFCTDNFSLQFLHDHGKRLP